MNQRNQVGLIREFKCTSSIIFLTHPEFIASVKKTFSIKEIFDLEKNSLWSVETVPLHNVTNKPMQTLHVVLQMPARIQDIETILKPKYLDSLSDIVAVEKHDEISKDDTSILMNVLPTLNKNSVSGVAYAVPQEYINEVPETDGIEKHKVIYGKKVKLLTEKENGKPVAYVLD